MLEDKVLLAKLTWISFGSTLKLVGMDPSTLLPAEPQL